MPPADPQKTFTIDERLRVLKSNFNQTRYSKTFGMSLEFDANHCATVHMPYNPDFDQLRGIHGAVFMTLLDTTGWFTVAAQYDTRIVTHEVHTYMLESAAEQDLTCTSRLIRAGRRIAVAEMEVVSADGRSLARATGTYVVTKRPLALPS